MEFEITLLCLVFTDPVTYENSQAVFVYFAQVLSRSMVGKSSNNNAKLTFKSMFAKKHDFNKGFTTLIQTHDLVFVSHSLYPLSYLCCGF